MRQYIRQITNDNFVYPNNNVKEYDVEIVHEIEDFSVSGSVVNLSATTITSTGITFNLDYVWLRNNAEVFIKNNGNLSILSVHMLAPSQSYFRPWRIIQTQETATTNINTLSALSTFTVFPSQLGIANFTTGTYYFEIRFIGHRAVFPVCYNLQITVP